MRRCIKRCDEWSIYQYLKFSRGNYCSYGSAVTVFRHEDADSRFLKKYVIHLPKLQCVASQKHNIGEQLTEKEPERMTRKELAFLPEEHITSDNSSVYRLRFEAGVSREQVKHITAVVIVVIITANGTNLRGNYIHKPPDITFRNPALSHNPLQCLVRFSKVSM